MVATLHLLAPGHVASVEVARQDYCALVDLERVRGALRMHAPQLLLGLVAHDALNLPASRPVLLLVRVLSTGVSFT